MKHVLDKTPLWFWLLPITLLLCLGGCVKNDEMVWKAINYDMVGPAR